MSTVISDTEILTWKVELFQSRRKLHKTTFFCQCSSNITFPIFFCCISTFIFRNYGESWRVIEMSKSKFKKCLKVVTNVMKLNFFSNLFCIGKIFFIDILFEQQSLSELMHFRYYIFIYHKFDNSLLFRCKIAFLNYIFYHL